MKRSKYSGPSSTSKTSHAAVYAVIVLLLVTGSAFVLNNRIGGIQVYDVYPTNSMAPTLEVGDLVIIHSVPYSNIHIGDVIVFARPDEPQSWPPVPPECVEGMVVVALPFLGRISEAFPPPLNYILVAAIIVLIFMAELFTGRKDDEEEVPEVTNRSEERRV